MKKTLYICIMLSSLLFIACDDSVIKIDWETENLPEKLVVEGNVTTDYGKHPITLKYSADYFSNSQAKMVTNAEVTIKSGSEEIQYTENPDKPGVYEAVNEFAGKLNTTYVLDIQLERPIDGTSEYSSTSELVEGMRIDSVTAELYYNPIMNSDEDSLTVVTIFYGLEPAEYLNYYMLKLFRNGKLVSDTISDYGHFSDIGFDINGETAFGLFLGEEYLPGDTFSFELHSIPKAYNIFLDGIAQISVPGDPFGFSGPPANAVGNINNGQGLGFFYAAHVTSGITIVKDKTDL